MPDIIGSRATPRIAAVEIERAHPCADAEDRSTGKSGYDDHAREPAEDRTPRRSTCRTATSRGITSATRSSRTSAASSRGRGRNRSPSSGSSDSSEQLPKGSDEWRIVPELTPDDAEPLVEKLYGDSFEDSILETVLSDLGVGPTRRRRRPDRCVRSLDAARRVRQGLRRDPRQRRPHDGGPDGMGSAAAGPGDRAHQPVLDRPDSPGRDSRRRRTKDV